MHEQLHLAEVLAILAPEDLSRLAGRGEDKEAEGDGAEEMAHGRTRPLRKGIPRESIRVEVFSQVLS